MKKPVELPPMYLDSRNQESALLRKSADYYRLKESETHIVEMREKHLQVIGFGGETNWIRLD